MDEGIHDWLVISSIYAATGLLYLYWDDQRHFLILWYIFCTFSKNKDWEKQKNEYHKPFYKQFAWLVSLWWACIRIRSPAVCAWSIKKAPFFPTGNLCRTSVVPHNCIVLLWNTNLPKKGFLSSKNLNCWRRVFC